MSTWNTVDLEHPLVSIRCITYNHEPYIRQCLEGLVMQKTNFRFEAIVHDDASMDRTAEIIREYATKYPNIIKPIYETENQYSKKDGSITRILNKHTRGKYIAMCEGDDYWTDPLKLQKQVDFLEAHEDYVLVHTDSISKNEATGQYIARKSRKVSDGFVFEPLLLHKFTISTLTVMFRKSAINIAEEQEYLNKKFLMGDYPKWLSLSLSGKFKYFPEVTACYRILEKSASHSTDINRQLRFLQSVYDIKQYFAEKHDVSDKVKQQIHDSSIHNKFKLYYRNGYYKEAVDVYSSAKKWFGIKTCVKYLISLWKSIV